MSKIDDARDILEQMGLPQAQRNDISCLTLLALTGLSEDDAWSQASKPSRSIHEILGLMRDTYGRDYAENTRESVRRQVIHQFEQARIVDRNPDEPDLPTNVPLPIHVCSPFCVSGAAIRPCVLSSLLSEESSDGSSAQLPGSSWPLCQPAPNVIPSWLSTQTRKSSVVTQLPSAVASNLSVPSTSSRLFPIMSLR